MKWSRLNYLLILFLCIIICTNSCTSSKTTSTDNERIPTRIPVSSSSTQDINNEISSITSSNSSSPKVSKSSSSISENAPSILAVVKTIKPNTTATQKLDYYSPSLNQDLYEIGTLRITIKNTSTNTYLNVYFNTYDDIKFSTKKSKKVYIGTSSTSISYTVDLSMLYGFSYRLNQIKIESGSILSGEIILEKIEICKGGERVYPFRIAEKTTIATRAQIKATVGGGHNFFPDGLMGVIKKPDGSYDFFGSNPILNGMQTIAIYNGSLDNPIKKLVAKDIGIINTPTGLGENQFTYSSIGQIYNFNQNEYFSIVHLEKHFDEDGKRSLGALYTCSLALGYSPDNCRTWYYAGEIATQYCESVHPDYGIGPNMPKSVSSISMGRDIGNGSFFVKDGFVYSYMIDCDLEYNFSLSLIRASLNDVISTARAKSVQRSNIFRKYYNNEFKEPAINGKFQKVIDDECPANFSSVSYNSYLKKYILVRCSSPQFSTNDGDIVMNISSDLTDFRGNNYYIDTGTRGQQYPTIIGKGDNPGFMTEKSFYIYYIDYEGNSKDFLWNHANLARREIILN